MRYFNIIILLFISNPGFTKEPGGGFWDNCPGSACPLNTPEMKTAEQIKKDKDIEILKENEHKLKELNDRIKELETEVHEER